MPKTPDEIKKGLECCTSRDCGGNKCPYFNEKSCNAAKSADALALIQQLQAERDAAVEMLKVEIGCGSCAKYTGTEEYVSNDCLDCVSKCNWEWRGVQKEE